MAHSSSPAPRSKERLVIVMLPGRPKSSEVDGVTILDVKGDVGGDIDPASSQSGIPERRSFPSVGCSSSLLRMLLPTELEYNPCPREVASMTYLSYHAFYNFSLSR